MVKKFGVLILYYVVNVKWKKIEEGVVTMTESFDKANSEVYSAISNLVRVVAEEVKLDWQKEFEKHTDYSYQRGYNKGHSDAIKEQDMRFAWLKMSVRDHIGLIRKKNLNLTILFSEQEPIKNIKRLLGFQP